ncbi:unnamed protein product [Prorocentrum cordatum]|uniref:Glycoside hydrolase family 13 N-terminal domain-containing protein n=1 Tax=Prorocentrum cordatum TaxID=2364126 RepID=A0ABN9WL83_9DINO|nr:unnamed protein product [Polarella glacialis]
MRTRFVVPFALLTVSEGCTGRESCEITMTSKDMDGVESSLLQMAAVSNLSTGVVTRQYQQAGNTHANVGTTWSDIDGGCYYIETRDGKKNQGWAHIWIQWCHAAVVGFNATMHDLIHGAGLLPWTEMRRSNAVAVRSPAGLRRLLAPFSGWRCANGHPWLGVAQNLMEAKAAATESTALAVAPISQRIQQSSAAVTRLERNIETEMDKLEQWQAEVSAQIAGIGSLNSERKAAEVEELQAPPACSVKLSALVDGSADPSKLTDLDELVADASLDQEIEEAGLMEIDEDALIVETVSVTAQNSIQARHARAEAQVVLVQEHRLDSRDLCIEAPEWSFNRGWQGVFLKLFGNAASLQALSVTGPLGIPVEQPVEPACQSSISMDVTISAFRWTRECKAWATTTAPSRHGHIVSDPLALLETEAACFSDLWLADRLPDWNPDPLGAHDPLEALAPVLIQQVFCSYSTRACMSVNGFHMRHFASMSGDCLTAPQGSCRIMQVFQMAPPFPRRRGAFSQSSIFARLTVSGVECVGEWRPPGSWKMLRATWRPTCNGASDMFWRQSVRSESGAKRGQAAAALLRGLRELYESMQLPLGEQRARTLGCPVQILRACPCACRGARFFAMSNVSVGPFYAISGVVAGCSIAIAFARIHVIPVVDPHELPRATNPGVDDAAGRACYDIALKALRYRDVIKVKAHLSDTGDLSPEQFFYNTGSDAADAAAKRGAWSHQMPSAAELVEIDRRVLIARKVCAMAAHFLPLLPRLGLNGAPTVPGEGRRPADVPAQLREWSWCRCIWRCQRPLERQGEDGDIPRVEMTQTRKARAMLPIFKDDPGLRAHEHDIMLRIKEYRNWKKDLDEKEGGLLHFAEGYHQFGFHRDEANKKWIFREWLPKAKQAFLIGEFNGWTNDNPAVSEGFGRWRVDLPDKPDGTWAVQHRTQAVAAPVRLALTEMPEDVAAACVRAVAGRLDAEPAAIVEALEAEFRASGIDIGALAAGCGGRPPR